MVRLSSDAQEHGVERATLEQRIAVHPGVLRFDPLVDQTSRAVLVPDKQQRKEMDLAVGITVSWSADPATQLTAVYQVGTSVQIKFGRC